MHVNRQRMNVQLRKVSSFTFLLCLLLTLIVSLPVSANVSVVIHSTPPAVRWLTTESIIKRRRAENKPDQSNQRTFSKYQSSSDLFEDPFLSKPQRVLVEFSDELSLSLLCRTQFGLITILTICCIICLERTQIVESSNKRVFVHELSTLLTATLGQVKMHCNPLINVFCLAGILCWCPCWASITWQPGHAFQ